MSSAICWTNHSKAVHCQLSFTQQTFQPTKCIWGKILELGNLGHNLLPEEKGCMDGMRSAPEWWRRQTGDANVHKFAPQPNWARGPYWCSFARCAESEVEEVEAADATLSNVNSSKSSNWGDFSGVHFGSSIYPAFDRALLFHIWGFLKWKLGQRILGSFNRRRMHFALIQFLMSFYILKGKPQPLKKDVNQRDAKYQAKWLYWFAHPFPPLPRGSTTSML